MNQRQYNIVKTMQVVGVTARRFATACKVSYDLMFRAYDSSNFERFVEREKMLTNGENGISPNDMLDQMGVSHG